MENKPILRYKYKLLKNPPNLHHAPYTPYISYTPYSSAAPYIPYTPSAPYGPYTPSTPTLTYQPNFDQISNLSTVKDEAASEPTGDQLIEEAENREAPGPAGAEVYEKTAENVELSEVKGRKDEVVR